MFDNIENLKIISSLHKDSQLQSKIENRSTHSFIIRVTGALEYNFGDQTFIAKAGEVMFIPKGSTYTFSASDMGTKKGYLSFYFVQIHNAIHYIQIGDKVKVAYSGRYSDENNYELISEKERYRKYTYTFTDADYQFALEHGTPVE